MPTTNFELTRNAFGKLILISDNQTHKDVVPIRAFPLQTPDENIAIMNTEGLEVGWINHLHDVSEQVRNLVMDELTGREFIPEILRIICVSSFSTPSTWTVETDRGATSFVLRIEEDIRRVGENLLITDSHGIHFLIRQPTNLDKHGRKILDRFL
ncbi:MAG: hypothetical protein K0R08_164 [Solimicrobium sp.]|jgi:hypothetical protein|nr:hypothetical protein [Solimicrobium sp.]